MQYSLSSGQLVPSCYGSLAPGSSCAQASKPTCKPTCPDVDSCQDQSFSCNAYYDTYTNSCDAGVFSY